MSIIEALIIAMVEGITEFLPISSTGHMILVSATLGMENSEFLKTFEISIQLGAILAIAWIYAKRFLINFTMYAKLFVAFLPTACIGFLAYGVIKKYLFDPMVVSITLILGGILLIWLDDFVEKRQSQHQQLDQIPFRNAFWIGLIQGISVIPGVSRAGATIVGGLLNGFNKRQATEFSFLLAVPTMMAATGYDLLKSPLQFTSQQIQLLSIGMIASFVFAWITVKLFLIFVEKYGFAFFGWYRIVLGALFAALIYFEVIP